ncbi:MAG: single-stranded-DNA-specific exonuclease [Pseudomonadota bacterium]|jgi:single-stranded-DNA-specific exonuclease
MVTLSKRAWSERKAWQLEQGGLSPLMARLYAARGISQTDQISTRMEDLIAPTALKGMTTASQILADAIVEGRKVCIVADYDADGATACAVAVKGLRLLGIQPDKLTYFVPDRFKLGYGLTPAIVDLVAQAPGGKPDLLITVDNGIASIDGVAQAKSLGMQVVITDHHLPGSTLPAADAIVNPNQPGCEFPSKNLAGVGVMLYVLMGLRQALRQRAWPAAEQANLGSLLDLVALGTIADVVSLDRNNRILVANGLHRIRQRRCCPGILALYAVAGKQPDRAQASDLGFLLGPRLNAAGRMDDMRIGIRCLLAEDIGEALKLAQELDRLNVARRSVEDQMKSDAVKILAQLDIANTAGISLYDPNWHGGVVGILAGRIKEQMHRPTVIFAGDGSGLIKGSGRSIPGFHLRDALDHLTKIYPDLIIKFGGHAMAAGLSIRESDFALFQRAFDELVDQLLPVEARTHSLAIDGPLVDSELSLNTAKQLSEGIWGQGFPAPIFANRFQILESRLLQDKHLKLTLGCGPSRMDAIRFNDTTIPTPEDTLAYALEINHYNGVDRPQLRIEAICPSP